MCINYYETTQYQNPKKKGIDTVTPKNLKSLILLPLFPGHEPHLVEMALDAGIKS
jgi:hypothetical protein